jgi:Winged helix DNA-binding domain
VRARRLTQHALATPAHNCGPAEVVRAMAGTHAQIMSAAELGIGLRLAGVTRGEVREALWTERTLVKTFGPRGTVHLLPAQDLPAWAGALSAMPPVPSPFPEGVRMTADQAEAVIEAIARALSDAELTVDELSEAVTEAAGSWAGDLVMPAFQVMWPRWRQAMHLAGMRGVLCFGPARGRKVTYTSPRRWLPGFSPAPARPALIHVVTSFLRAYGPATPRRFAHWLNAPPRWADEVFASLCCQATSRSCWSTAWWPGCGTSGARAAGWTSPSSRCVPSPPDSAANSTARASALARFSRPAPGWPSAP